MKLQRIIAGCVALSMAANVWAGIKTNTVYRIVNVGAPGQSMAISASGQGAVTIATNADDPKQQWYITASEDDASTYYLQNVASGAYLKSPLQIYLQWPMVSADDAMLMTITEHGENYVIRSKSHTYGYGYAHRDASNTIVCWEPENPNTQWSFVEVPMTPEELEDLHKKIQQKSEEMGRAGLYQSYLDELFADKACTQLKVDGDLSQNESYNALPPVLKNMVDKVRDDNWAETSGDWNSHYAKKYRVQLYEPYSEGAAAAGLAGVQPYTNMNNPTGIVADAEDMLYIMVDDPVPAGATLYIGAAPDEQMYNSVTGGVELHQGLNTILCYGDNTHFFMYYTVNTVKNGKPSEYKVTDFSPIKIHIEGGRVNGFFNYVGDELYTPDTREDFLYTSQRATHIMYDLVGKYVILHFFLNDMPSKPGQTNLQKGVKSSLDPQLNPGGDREYDPVKIMQKWDNMCLAERILMGLQNDADIADPYNRGYYSSIVNDNYRVGDYIADPGFYYSDYFNNRMMGISQQGDLYMNATSWRTAYNVSTIDYVLTQFYHDGLWGPAHEYGHMNQGPINMAGTTEVSNNIFSNVALYFSDKSTTSRSEYISSALACFNQNKPFIEYGTLGTTRMFWQLWCYYHATQHNTKFYPRLYELLRRNPLKKSTIPNTHYARYDQLHFAKMCCIAAEEDLTDFFTAWGFFVPLDNYRIDDYSQYDAVLTQEDIDAVKKEIAQFGFKKNDAIILIDDRPGSDKPSEGGFPKEKAGELGGLGDFINGAIPSGHLTYSVDKTTVTVTVDGTDGVGYLVFDEEGNICGFANSHSFEVTSEVAAKLMAGTATLRAIGSDNSTLEVTNIVTEGSDDEKRDLLQSLIAHCDSLLAYGDPDEIRVGYLYPEACKPLKNRRDDAQSLLDNPDTKGDDLTRALIELSDEYSQLANNEAAYIPVIPGATYRLVNSLYPTYVLTSNMHNATSATFVEDEAVPFGHQWIFDLTNDNNYTLRNLDNGLYLGSILSYNVSLPMTETPQSYTLVPASGKIGYYALAPDNRANYAVHRAAGGTIVPWYTTAEASHWTITRINPDGYAAMRDDLSALISQAAALLDSVGTIWTDQPEKMELNENCFYSNACYRGNNADAFTSWNVLIDDDIETYFHSRYNDEDSDDGLDHYIRIEAPGEETFRHFEFTYITRNVSGSSTNITAFRIDGSPDGVTWTDICTVNSGLETGAAKQNSTGEITAPQGTRYIRFIVTRSGGTARGHAFFAIAEISVTNRTDDALYTPYEQYPDVLPADMQALADAISAARDAYNSPASTVDELQAAYDALAAACDALRTKMNPTGAIERVDADTDLPAQYYNLLGVPVSKPEQGLYLKRQGHTTTKVLVK